MEGVQFERVRADVLGKPPPDENLHLLPGLSLKMEPHRKALSAVWVPVPFHNLTNGVGNDHFWVSGSKWNRRSATDWGRDVFPD